MGSSVSFFAGHDDDVALREFAKSIGLILLHPYAPRMTEEKNQAAFDNPIQGGFFSFLSLDALHPRTNPPGELCEVIDPLIPYVRPYYAPPILVAGHLFWNTDVSELARQTKPYFQKLRRWVQSNWKMREEDGYYIGPQAQKILEEERARIAYLPPEVKVRTIVLD